MTGVSVFSSEGKTTRRILPSRKLLSGVALITFIPDKDRPGTGPRSSKRDGEEKIHGIGRCRGTSRALPSPDAAVPFSLSARMHTGRMPDH